MDAIDAMGARLVHSRTSSGFPLKIVAFLTGPDLVQESVRHIENALPGRSLRAKPGRALTHRLAYLFDTEIRAEAPMLGRWDRKALPLHRAASPRRRKPT